MKKIVVNLSLALAVFCSVLMFSQANAEELKAKISNITGEATVIRAGQQKYPRKPDWS